MLAPHRESRTRRSRAPAPALALTLGTTLSLACAGPAAAFDLFHFDQPAAPQGSAPAGAVAASSGKLTLGLDTLGDEYAAHVQALAQGQPATAFASQRTIIATPNDRVSIDAVAAADAQALASALQALGAEVHATAGRLVSASLPLSRLSALGSVAELAFAQPAISITWTGSVTSQGDAGQRSDLGRANYGVDGSGTIVGVISDSYDCFGADGLTDDAAADIASGDLPAAGVDVVLDDAAPGCSVDNIDEGRAMAQIVHDVAPGAGIAFHTANGGQATFAQGILDLQSVANADIIVDDIIYFAEPMFQDGVIAQAVETVVANGSAYFSSAGNNAREAYQAAFVDSGQVGFNGGPLHDFDPSPGVDTRLNLQQLTDTTYVLQWQDRYFSVSGTPGAESDLSMCFYSGATFLGCTSTGNIGSDPIDGGGLGGGGNLDVEIELRGGPAPGLVKLVAFGGIAFTDAYAGTSAGTVYGHANAANANAVGASYYGFNPAFGTDPPVLNDFSSAGNTPIRFDTAGNPVVEDREKPEFTAPDGGDNTFFGSDFEPNGFPNFFGTSAAAPHAAAVAALMLERNPSLTPAQITAILRDTAIDILERRDIGTGAFIADLGAGYDNDSGEGLIDAEAAVAASAPEADLSIAKTDSADPVIAGNALTYTVTVTNNGPDTAEDVVVTDTLPPQVPALLATTGCAEDPAGAPNCTIGTLAAGSDAVVTLVVEVPAGLSPQTITNSASVSAGTSDPDDSNNSTSEDTTVVQAAICDANRDGSVDRLDLGVISRARGQPVTGPDDPRDGNGDGRLTTSDVRACIPHCDRPRCALP